MKLRALTVAFAALLACIGLLAAGCGGGESGDDILFVSSREGDYAIFGMNADGGAQGRLTEEKGDPSTTQGLAFQIHPAWSRDGAQIAFASAREGTFDIFVMDADGTNIERITSTDDDDGNPTWSPDAGRIAFQRGDQGHIYVMDADGTDAQRLTDDAAEESEPAWSPDGEWIAYSRRQPGSDLREIWIAKPDGSVRRQLTTLNAAAYTPAWSPDGEAVAFSANRGGTRYDIYTIGADGKGLRRAVRSAEDAFEPSWSPDGRELAFQRGGAIFTIDEDGDEVQITDAANNDSSPAWRPVADDGDGTSAS